MVQMNLMRKLPIPSLLAAVLLPGLLACQAMTPVGSSAKGGLSGSSTVAGKPAGEDLPGSSSENAGDMGPSMAPSGETGGSVADTGNPPVSGPVAGSPEYHSAIAPYTSAPAGGGSVGDGSTGKTYAWGPEATMPPKSDPDYLQWCFLDGKIVPCPGVVWAKPSDPAPYDPSKEREPEAFRMLLGSHPFNTQEAEPLPKSVEVFEDQNGFQLYPSYIVQVGATFPKTDGTSAFGWWDIIQGPYFRIVFTSKGQPPASSTYFDLPIDYRNTSGGNWNASSCWMGCDVHEGDTVTFYLYYDKDPLFKKPPQPNLAGVGEPAVPFAAGAYEAFVADTKHVHALGSFIIRDGNAPMMIAPGRSNRRLDPIAIPRSAP